MEMIDTKKQRVNALIAIKGELDELSTYIDRAARAVACSDGEVGAFLMEACDYRATAIWEHVMKLLTDVHTEVV